MNIMKLVDESRRDSLVESDERNLLLILNEVRGMNRLQRENIKSIDQMSEQITYYQNFIDFVFVNKWNTNQIVREIRIDLLRLKILADPNMEQCIEIAKKNPLLLNLYLVADSINRL